MSRLLCTFALTLALPGAAFAQDLPPAGNDWGGLLIEAIEANGCSMTEEEAAEQLPPLGFEEDWTVVVVEDLIEEGLAELRESDFSLVLKTENCKG